MPEATLSDSDRRWRDLKRMGEGVELPEGVDLYRLALEVICSKGVPSYLTPYGSIRSIAAFVVDKRDDPFYTDGETLLRAAVGASAERGAE